MSLNDVVPIDPLLSNPLDLYGSNARVRTICLALANALGIGDRILQSNIPALLMMWRMIDPIVDALEKGRVSIHERAHWIAHGALPEDGGEALTVLMAIGPAAETIHGGTPGEVCGQVKRALERRMEFLLLRCLRAWTKESYLEDVGNTAAAR